MPTLCKPAVAVPEHQITLEQTLSFAKQMHGTNSQLELALRLIKNLGVKSRYLIMPAEEIILTKEYPSFEVRNQRYEFEAKRMVPSVVAEALANAQLTVTDIDLLVYVSCTGFMMPSMTAWLINTLGFRPTTRQLPIAQLGCAGGGAAINRAYDFCVAHPKLNALVVCCEFCSLCYQPLDLDVGSLLSNGLFGDAVGAVVLRGVGGTGVKLRDTSAFLIPNTEDWISFDVKETGFHFRLDKRVPTTMAPIAPYLCALASGCGWDVSQLAFYIVHAGGPRILDDLCKFLNVDPHMFRYSRATLVQYGNIASVVVLDALLRLFNDGGVKEEAPGLIAAFGPGITAEMTAGTWTHDSTTIT